MSIHGKVKWFNEKKGYGFIIAPDGRDVFVHYREIVQVRDEFQTLMDGEDVTFELSEGKRGPEAKHVIRDPSAAAEDMRITRI